MKSENVQAHPALLWIKFNCDNSTTSLSFHLTKCVEVCVSPSVCVWLSYGPFVEQVRYKKVGDASSVKKEEINDSLVSNSKGKVKNKIQMRHLK